MAQVNLLPHDVLQGQKYRRRTLTILALGAAVLGLIGLFFVLQIGRLSTVNGDIEDAQQSNNSLQTQINDNQKYEDLQVQAQQAQGQLDEAYAGEVSFSGMLMDLSRVIPSDAFLTSFSTTITPAAPTEGGGTTTTTTTPLIGTMTMSGEAIGFDSLSQFLTRLEMVQGWVNPWMPTISADSAVANAFTFTVSVDLTDQVETPRGRGEVSSGG
jgi:Tfp pilus assembly protein PilN